MNNHGYRDLRKQRAGECLGALNECITRRDSALAKEIYEKKVSEFKKDYGVDYKVFLDKDRQR